MPGVVEQKEQSTEEQAGGQPQLPAFDYSGEPAACFVDVGHVIHGPEMFAVVLGESSPFDRNLKARLRVSFRAGPPSFFGIVCALASNWNKWAAAHIGPESPRFVMKNGPTPLEKENDDDV